MYMNAGLVEPHLRVAQLLLLNRHTLLSMAHVLLPFRPGFSPIEAVGL